MHWFHENSIKIYWNECETCTFFISHDNNIDNDVTSSTVQLTIEKIRAKYISTLNQFYHANRGVTNKSLKFVISLWHMQINALWCLSICNMFNSLRWNLKVQVENESSQHLFCSDNSIILSLPWTVARNYGRYNHN